MKITTLDQTIELHPQGGVLLDDGTLVVADLHLGKATAFQAQGLAIPEGDSEADIKRLIELCHWFNARRLVINGDLFHSDTGLTEEIEQLIQTLFDNLRGIPVDLVLGNHDRKLPRIPHDLKVHDQLVVDGWHIVHDPADAPRDQAAICAHLHPVARIADGKRTSLRLPCFLLRGEMLVLPSFGTFTGGSIIDRQKGDRVFVAPGEQVIEVPPKLLRK